VDVGSLLVTDAEAAELIEPGESSLHNPTPLPQGAAVPRVALCQERLYAANAQPLPDRLRVIRAIADKTVGTTAWASTSRLEWRNGRHQ
jgi:hypothetical protein